MFSASVSIPDDLHKEEKIELILVLQKHPVDAKNVSGDFTLDDEKTETIYSQFNTMKIVQRYPDAAVLTEGNHCDVTPSHVKGESGTIFRLIFPEYKNLHEMKFDKLTENQITVLTNNLGVQILLHMGITPCIYQTAKTKLDMRRLTTAYADSYRECLKNYPILAVKALQNGSLSLKNLDTLDEIEEYEKFKKEVRQKNPDMFYHREKEALEFVLVAAKKSGKKQVVLIFGSAHAAGFVELIETMYRHQIILTKCIDSCEGFNNADERRRLELQHAEAVKCYKAGEYQRAVTGFVREVSFWQATPESTPTKFSSLLTCEFNLGSSLFKLAESDETCSYEEAIPHLKKAATIAQGANIPAKKYIDRHAEAIKRHYLTSFFSKIGASNAVSRLVISYSVENEGPVSSM